MFGVNVYSEESRFALSVGKIILENDRQLEIQTGYRYQNPNIFNLINDEYNSNIAPLPILKRVEFYKSLLIHLDLGGEDLLEFTHLINACCFKEFSEMLSLEINGFIPDRRDSAYAKKYILMSKLLFMVNRNEKSKP